MRYSAALLLANVVVLATDRLPPFPFSGVLHWTAFACVMIGGAFMIRSTYLSVRPDGTPESRRRYLRRFVLPCAALALVLGLTALGDLRLFTIGEAHSMARGFYTAFLVGLLLYGAIALAAPATNRTPAPLRSAPEP